MRECIRHGCKEPVMWCFETEDGTEHDTCGSDIHVALQEICDEYGDGAPVFVYMVTED